MILLFDIDSLLYSSCYNVDSPEEAMWKFDESYQKIVNDIEEFYEVEETIPTSPRLTRQTEQAKSRNTLTLYVSM